MVDRTNHIDWLTLIPTFFLSFFGIIVIASTQPSLLVSHASSVMIGLVVLWILSRVHPQQFMQLSPILYGISVIFLIGTLFFPDIRGSSRWILLGDFQFQPSELVKPLLLVFFASYFSQQSIVKISSVLTGVALFIVPLVIIFLQPDFGSVVVFSIFFASLLLVAGLPWRFFALLSAIAMPISFVVYELLHDYQRTRIATFLAPHTDPQGAGYNALQALIAVGSGGIFGRGFGRGIQSHLRFLPEHHTDFIFASFAEEFGLIGGTILIVFFGLLLWRLLRSAQLHPNKFTQIYAGGLFVQLFTQFFINVGMNMNLLPITGITLPLVSYGRSSLIATYVSIGIFLALTGSKKHTALADLD